MLGLAIFIFLLVPCPNQSHPVAHVSVKVPTPDIVRLYLGLHPHSGDRYSHFTRGFAYSHRGV